MKRIRGNTQRRSRCQLDRHSLTNRQSFLFDYYQSNVHVTDVSRTGKDFLKMKRMRHPQKGEKQLSDSFVVLFRSSKGCAPRLLRLVHTQRFTHSIIFLTCGNIQIDINRQNQ